MFSQYERDKLIQQRSQDLDRRLARYRLLHEAAGAAAPAQESGGRIFRLPAMLLTILKGA